MPVKIGSFEPLSEDEFDALRQRKARQANPVMSQLLDEVERGTPVRVPLEDGQTARGLRVAIARAASNRGLSVETMEGDGFVAVRKSTVPRVRKPATGDGQRRRGRPRKNQEQDAAEIASLTDLATGEA
jgi:hypothetical protein